MEKEKKKKEKGPEDAGLSFIKLLKDIYKEEMQFNIGDNFVIYSKDGIDKISFPGLSRVSVVIGDIALDEANDFAKWLNEKDGQVSFENTDVDELRKSKIGSFKRTEFIGDELHIVTSEDDGTEKTHVFKRTTLSQKEVIFGVPEYTIQIPADLLHEPMLNVYKKIGENSLTFDKSESESTIVNIPTKSIEITMKKSAEYLLSIGNKDAEGFSRLVELRAKTKRLNMRQYFRVVEF
jgi:hypothetical protein